MDPTRITEWLKLSSEHLFEILLSIMAIFAVLTFAPDNCLGTLGLQDCRDEHRTLLGVALLFSFAGLIVRGVKFPYEWGAKRIRAH